MLKTLKEYRDRCYINSILCEASYIYYNTINNIIIFPTILGSSILTCLNSSNIDADKIKYINIAINGVITIILAITTQYKIHDRINAFKVHQIKYTKLNHSIEAILNTKKEEEISAEDTVAIVGKYDVISEELIFTYPHHIRSKVIKKYEKTNITLPNSLAIDASIVIEN
jgi:hypothetical protein